jgi:hypothetical protein
MFKSIFILLLCSLMAVGALSAQYGRVTQGEYFWNADPGEGNGTALVAEDGNFSTALERVLGNSLALPATAGLHRLGVRVRVADGSWSAPFSTVVEVRQNLTAPVINVSQAEFYWDTDPGEGNATPLLAFDGNFNAAFEQVFQNNIALPATVGLHQLGVRVRSNDGNWSSVFLSVIEVRQNLTAPVINVSQAEFYWDTDPGEGNATPLLAFDGNFNAAFEQVFQNNIALPATIGLHHLGVRVRSNDGNWSSVFLSVIEVRQDLTAPVINVSQAEFYWDTDPGEGNATPLLAFDGNFNAAFERVFQNNIALPATIGLHQLGVRVRSNDGNWSSVFLSVIEVREDLTAPVINVSQAEFFWDTDPGQGNGTPLLAFDGNFNAAFERLVSGSYTIPASLSVGLHRLYTRARSNNGNWSSLFVYVIDIETSNLPILDTILGAQQLCATGTITGLNYSVNSDPNYSYTWTLSSGTIVGGQNTNAVTVNWASAGTHQIQVIACNAFGCDTSTTQINISAAAASPTASASANSFCTGGNTILSSSSAPSGYTYQWYVGSTAISLATNQNYTATTAGNYQVGFIGGCASPLSNTLAISVSSAPNQPLVIGGGSTCQNSIGLSTSTAPAGYGYQWYVGGNAISGANSQSYTAVADGNYQVNYTGACPSALSPLVSVALNAAGPAAATISSSSAVICNGANITLQSTIAPAGYTYQWYRNAVMLPTVSASSYTADLPGIYYVVLIGACPVSASNSVTITTISSPAAPTASASATSFCAGGNAILSGNTAPSGYGYQWYLGGNAISGAVNQNYTATTSGNYSLIFIGACPSSNSNALAITVENAPATPNLMASGALTFCAGDSAVLTASPATPPANYSYQWYNNGNPIAGASNATFVVRNTGSYTLRLEGNCPSGFSIARTSTVFTPLVPVISYDATLGRIEAISPQNSQINQYNWYFQNAIIPAAIGSFVFADTDGSYFLEIEDINGCISRSNVIQVGGTIGVTVMGDAQTMYAVYPNPTQGEFMLENKGELQALHIRLTNVLGQVLQDKALSASNIHHLYMDYPAGAYFLQVVDNEGKTTIFTIIKKDF